MAQQDLEQKTRFEKQIPFLILAEIAQAVKDRQNDFSIYPESSIDLLSKISEQGKNMEEQAALVPLDALRPQALELIAKLIRFVKINTPE